MEFVIKCKSKYLVNDVYCDSADPVLIRGLRNAAIKAKLRINVHNAYKGAILDRIRLYAILMSQDRYKIMRRCKRTIDAFGNAQWDPKHDDTRLDDGTTNIDSLDAQEYTTEGLANNLLDMTLLRM